MQIRRLIYTVALLMVAGMLFGQEKVVDQSAKKAPSWLGLSESGYIVTSAENETLDGAKAQCLANIRQSIVSSVAVNISSTETYNESISMEGNSMDAKRRYNTEIESIAASLPFVSDILLDDAELYWRKIYNKKDKTYKYEVHAKYPFPSYKRDQLIAEFMAQDKEQYDKYLKWEEGYSSDFTEVEYIDRAISELHALRKYFFDAKRQNEVDALVSNYRRLYKAISIVPFSEKLGEIIYYLELDGRRVTCSRKATLKSEYATNLQVKAIEDNLYKITYKYDYCLPEDENTIIVSQKVGSVTAKNTFYSDPK